jgi:hypothetical protein
MGIPPCPVIDSQLLLYFYTHTLSVVNKCFPNPPNKEMGGREKGGNQCFSFKEN